MAPASLLFRTLFALLWLVAGSACADSESADDMADTPSDDVGSVATDSAGAAPSDVDSGLDAADASDSPVIADAFDPTDGDGEIRNDTTNDRPDTGDRRDANEPSTDARRETDTERPPPCEWEPSVSEAALDPWSPICPDNDSGTITLATPEGEVIALTSATFGSTEAIVYAVEAESGAQWLELALYHVVDGPVLSEPLVLRADDERLNPSFSIVGTNTGFAVVWTEAAGDLLDEERDIESFVALVDPDTGDFDLPPTSIGADQALASSAVAAPDGGIRFAARLRFDEEEGPTTVAHMVKLDPVGVPFGTHFITNADTLTYLDTAPDGDFLVLPFVKGGENAGALQYFETQTTLPICSFPVATELQYEAALPESAALINGRLVALRPDPPPPECRERQDVPGTGGFLAVTSLFLDESIEVPTPWLDATAHWLVAASDTNAEAGLVLAARAGTTGDSWRLSAAPFELTSAEFGSPRVVAELEGAVPAIRPALRLFKSSVVRVAWLDSGSQTVKFRSFCAAPTAIRP